MNRIYITEVYNYFIKFSLKMHFTRPLGFWRKKHFDLCCGLLSEPLMYFQNTEIYYFTLLFINNVEMDSAAINISPPLDRTEYYTASFLFPQNIGEAVSIPKSMKFDRNMRIFDPWMYRKFVKPMSASYPCIDSYTLSPPPPPPPPQYRHT